MEKVRVQKYMSDCGLMSRRSAEKEIEAGNVSVNGEVAYLGMKVLPGKDIVKFKGKQVRKTVGHFVYIMLNKPKGYVTTMSDEAGRKCVAELVSACKTRVYPVGRLDMPSEGLLLMTNDGELANRLTHPSHDIPKKYRVKVSGSLTNHTIKTLSEPMIIDGYRTRAAQCEVLSSEENIHTILITLHEGRNRQIRKMCEQVGLRVCSLKRIAIGELEIGNLPRGRWTYLREEEVEYLKGEREHVNDTTDRE